MRNREKLNQYECRDMQTIEGNMTKGRKELREMAEFLRQEDGVGVIEVVLILVVLIGLVIVFKEQINQLLQNIFKEINSQSKEVY